MWLDMLLILVAVSPLMPLSRFGWQSHGSTADREHEAQLTACSVPR
jgi:hypothetical protein